jgi:murein DD-endopeptidase MepM/ murein hydrolase activator NlpD
MVKFPVPENLLGRAGGRRPRGAVASRRYSIVIADRTSGVIRRFTLPMGPTVTTTVVALALPILIGLGARWSATAALEDLTATNARLTVENQNYREATGQLSSQISALQAAVDEIGVTAAVDPAASRAMESLPAAVRSRAMGGGVAGTVLGSALGPGDTAFSVMRDVLGAIETRLDAVRTGVERRRSLADATPSIWPVAGWLTSAFGNRRDPFTGGSDFHPGLDISANRGDQVLSPATGTVYMAAWNGSYGNMVAIDHGYGIVTKYGHLSRFAVMNGQQVNRGDVIGFVGSTGRSTSPHLHYEIWVNGKLTNPMKLLASQ